MPKLTKEQVEEIQKQRNEGMKVETLAKLFNVAENTICYWTGRKERVIEYQKKLSRDLSKEKKKEKYLKQKPYFKEYFKKRYHEDEEFRKKHIERIMRNKKK